MKKLYLLLLLLVPCITVGQIDTAKLLVLKRITLDSTNQLFTSVGNKNLAYQPITFTLLKYTSDIPELSETLVPALFLEKERLLQPKEFMYWFAKVKDSIPIVLPITEENVYCFIFTNGGTFVFSTENPEPFTYQFFPGTLNYSMYKPYILYATWDPPIAIAITKKE